MKATLVRLTFVNGILNPYSEKRPKKPEKKYDIYEMFMKFSNRKFPITLSFPNSRLFDAIVLHTMSVCLPGGRGCVGTERMGKKKLNRQTAIIDNKGLRFNPLHNKSNKSKYGQIQLTGIIKYKDGTSANISIPVETSGVIGVRMGTTLKINPVASNSDDKVKSMIHDVEDALMSFLSIAKERANRIISMNGIYNMYSDKLKTERPKIKNFKNFISMMYKNGLMSKYKKTPMANRQGGASVMKTVFKSNDKAYPTITISPYGHVEIMGALSVKMIANAYKLVNDTFANVRSEVTFMNMIVAEKTSTRKHTKKNFTNVSIMNKNIILNNKENVIVKGKTCNQLPKPIIKLILKRYGLLDKGTKADMCNRLKTKLKI